MYLPKQGKCPHCGREDPFPKPKSWLDQIKEKEEVEVLRKLVEDFKRHQTENKKNDI